MHSTRKDDQTAADDARCSCGNRFDGDNLCMVSACQWEGLEDQRPSAESDDAPLSRAAALMRVTAERELHPAVAIAVANWLEYVADVKADSLMPADQATISRALAVASAYLGSDQ